MFFLFLLMTLTSWSQVITKVGKNKVLIDLQDFKVEVADEFQVGADDDVAIIKILQIKNNRALAEIIQGQAKVGMKLTAPADKAEQISENISKHSYDLDLGYQMTTGYSATSLSVGYYYNNDDPEFSFSSLNLSTSAATTKSVDDTNADLILKTKSFDLDLGLSISESFNIGLGLSQSQTPESGYSSGGGSVSLKFFNSEESEKTDFQSSTSVNIKIQYLKIYQQISALASAPTTIYLYPITQWSAGLHLGWQPEKKYSFHFGAEYYSYDKPNSELQMVPRFNFVNYRASTLASTISGLLSFNLSTGASLYFENWTAGLSLDHSSTVIQDQITNSLGLSLGYQFDTGINLAVGAINSKTNDDQSVLYTFGLNYAF